MLNVREVIESHSQATTLRELEAKGRSKVRVINASEIAKLVENSVRQVIANANGSEGMQQLIEKSKAEFRELKRQRDEEHMAREDGKRELERAQGELRQLHQQVTELRAKGDSGTRTKELEGALTAERARVQEMRTLVEAITKERDLARDGERKAVDAAKSVNASLPAGGEGGVLAQLAAQVAKLSERIENAPAGAGGVAATGDMGALNKRLDALTSGIAERLDKFGRSVGVSSAIDAPEVKLDAIFNQNEKLENNMANVELKQQKGSGIGGALDRMKKMRGGSAPKKDVPKDEPK